MTRIGHNGGPPLDPDRSWRAHCWRRARRELVPRLPLEVVRRRVARARQLGLEYPDYAAILLGTGRDVVAFLFTSEALGLRLRHGTAPPADALRARTLDRLRALSGCDRLLLERPGLDPEALRRALAEAHAIRFRAAGAAPADAAGWAEGGRALVQLVDPLKLPRDGVVMIGAREAERAWVAAARLARWLPAERYFRG